MTNKDKYLQEIKAQLQRMLRSSKEGYQMPEIEQYRLEGFMKAGTFLDLVSNTDLTKLMEQTHREVFGKPIKTSTPPNDSMWGKSKGIDYSQYDRPTYMRHLADQ